MINFGSDNEASVMPEILEALLLENSSAMAPSYGEDSTTERLNNLFSELFEKNVYVYPVLTGTAANAIALAQVTDSHSGVLCHENSHIQHDECGAVEFMTGGKLVLLPSQNGKLSAKDIDEKMSSAYPHGYHNSLITSVSLAQATEYGTIYTPAEIKSIALTAKSHGLNVHVDGARFANALATLKCTPAELTWKAGIDIMSFGSSKNGTMNAEAIIVFSENANKDIKRKLKRSGQLVSKMRYISCQLEAYLYKDRWLNWANKANQLALNLSNEIKKLQSIQVIYPVQTNSLVIKMTDALADYLLEQGINFYPWSGSENCYRLVLSNMNKQSDINYFVESVKAWQK